MLRRDMLAGVFASLLGCGAVPAHATDSHDYGKGEYVVIRDGLAPSKRFSLAATAAGDGKPRLPSLRGAPATKQSSLALP
jgi:hypothetical protein